MTTTTVEPEVAHHKAVNPVPSATIRFCGDSGDGMQITGDQFTSTSALLGNDVATFPDYPAEIRAPRGTLAGVSGFQVHFSSEDIFTPGDTLDALVVMNPAALKTNLRDLRKGGTARKLQPCSARPRVGFAFGTQLSTTKEGLTRSRGRQFRHLTFHRNINKSKGGATQGLVFAKHQRKVAADVSFGEGDCAQDLGLNIFENIRAGNKPNPNIDCYETLEQFTRIEFHSIAWLQLVQME